jgi:hypothetical protein
MGLAHCAGLLGVAIVGAVMSADPSADEVIGLFVLGLFISAFLFVPILAVALVFLRDVLRNRIAFVVLGPVVLTLLATGMLGLDAGKVIAVETTLSSLVLFLLIRGDEVPDSEAA